MKSTIAERVEGTGADMRLLGGRSRVERARTLGAEGVHIRAELQARRHFDRMVGSSPAMSKVFDLIDRVAASRLTVLLTGETGTGKDLVAETIHRISLRSRGPFVAVNCGATQASLIESELFGHEAGSFTGASRTHKGVFEQASGGTLFLDEITEMRPELQVLLLRVLEGHEIQRVGGEKTIRVDVRLIAATNRAPERAVEDAQLREDLFYRLNVFPIHVPPLRERGDDIALLAGVVLDELNELSAQSKAFTRAAIERLGAYGWPGNVRELRNVIERAYLLSDDSICVTHLGVELSDRSVTAKGECVCCEVGLSLAEVERRMILATLDRLEQNKRESAKTLGISLKTLYNRLNSYGLGKASQRK